MTPTNPTPDHTIGRADLSEVTWRGREAIRIANEAIHLILLAQGGVLAEFVLDSSKSNITQNALWESPWFSEASLPSGNEAIVRAYGDLGTGRFLNRYTGHALCLDGFGAASEEDVLAGAGLHGEATLLDWELRAEVGHASAKVRLPLAQLALERRLSIKSGETVVRIEERITNFGQARHLHWVQHATVGPPMFDDSSVVSASVSDGFTWPFTYEGVPLLKIDASFTWPQAPRIGEGTLDLSKLFTIPHTGFVAAARQVSGREYGFVAALNPTKQIALIYLFPATVFHWITFWEENCCRREWPWVSATQARGLEFGTTPLPLGNAHVDAAGPLLNTPTSLPLGAGASMCAPWLMAITQVPATWRSVHDITVEPNSLILHRADETVAIQARGVEAFLSSAGESAWVTQP